MIRRAAHLASLVLALALSLAGAAQACGDNAAKPAKPDMSKPAAPKTAT